MKKIIISTILLVLSTGVFAGEGESTGPARNQIGTSVLTTLVIGTSFGGQVAMSDNMAFAIDYTSIDDVEVFGDRISGDATSFSLKTYNSTGNYWRFGLVDISITDGYSDAEGTLPIITWGTEKHSGSLVFGGEVGYGAGAGLGLFGAYVGFLLD